VTVFAIDASTLLAFLLPEAHTAAAQTFFESITPADELVAPAFLLVECTSNIRERLFDGLITNGEASEALDIALSLPIRPVVELAQHSAALRISDRRHTKKAYDAHYLAVADIERAEMVTIDGGMYQGAIELRLAARLLR
jgi:predicted nucleic acid-binding protein